MSKRPLMGSKTFFFPDPETPTFSQPEPADDPFVRLRISKPKEKVQRPIPKTAEAAGQAM